MNRLEFLTSLRYNLEKGGLPREDIEDALASARSSVQKSDLELFRKYFLGMLDEGIYLAPSQFEAIFVSAAHTESDIDRTVDAARKVFKNL